MDEASLLLGITLGARGTLPASLKEACIRAGVYHIVVVSGQNMALIVGLGVSFLLIMRIPKRHALWACALPVIFYTSAVGGDPPVMRAATMALIGLLVSALGRDVPRYCPLLLAAGWILIREPEALLGASFQLSFGATASILAILPFWEEGWTRGSRWKRWLKDAALMGLTVHLGIWPLLVFYFHRISLVGFIANWTVFPLSAILMVMGLFVGTWGVFWRRNTVPVFGDARDSCRCKNDTRFDHAHGCVTLGSEASPTSGMDHHRAVLRILIWYPFYCPQTKNLCRKKPSVKCTSCLLAGGSPSFITATSLKPIMNGCV